MKRAVLISALLLASPLAKADCWDHAGSMFNISPDLLYAIALQESGMRPDAIGRNRDGSRDLGLMQINSIHLPRLRQLGVNESQLLESPCLSVVVGASILSDMMKRYGYSWEAVGAYNAGLAPGRHELRMRYARQVWRRYQKLQGPSPAR
ncbi:type III secretion system invasion protein IagB [Chromobacterium phragmitis]|uniref:Type III secretion system invasion protein IagB n=1 Tax=Chromobacterium phragmitis TaxID=2202141 RepID=A0A344UDP7_9NEIS|nr:type III secretion system invasion protein IagB [Chromobacterium phragmitis]AXE33395.1 type III secretion system invasion protein IagB [Chromobacterium phragmitis]